MGSAQNIKSATTDLRVGRRIHNTLYGGKDGTIFAVDGQPGLGNSLSALGGAVQITRGPEAHVNVVWDNGTISRKLPECIVTGVQWSFLDEPDHSPEQIERAIVNVEIESLKAEIAKQEKAQNFETGIQRYRASKEHSHLEQTPVEGGHRRLDTLAAKNIRKELKRVYPGVKFSVRKRSFDAIMVTWPKADDGETVNQRTVRDSLALFKTGHYDPMEDYHSSSNSPFNVVFGGADYLICQRDF